MKPESAHCAAARRGGRLRALGMGLLRLFPVETAVAAVIVTAYWLVKLMQLVHQA